MKYNYALLAGLALVTMLSGKVESAPAGQTISQQCNLEQNLSLIRVKIQTKALYSSCEAVKNYSIKTNPTKEAELNSEWEVIQKKIREKESQLPENDTSFVPVPHGYLAKKCDFERKLAESKNIEDLKKIRLDCMNELVLYYSKNTYAGSPMMMEWTSLFTELNISANKILKTLRPQVEKDPNKIAEQKPKSIRYTANRDGEVRVMDESVQETWIYTPKNLKF